MSISPLGIRPTERVAAFIDGPNFYAAAKNAGVDTDFKKLRAHLGDNSQFVRAYYYTPVSDTEEFSPVKPLVDWLGYNGFQMVTKPLKEYTDAEGRKKTKGSMNVELTINAMELADKVDHIILFSGDGELAPMIEAVQRKGVRVTVVSSKDGNQSMISDDLRRQADAFVDLSSLSSTFGRGAGSAPSAPFQVERRPVRTPASR